LKASLTALAAILLTGLTSGSASAQAPYYGPPQAPDMCGPGFWAMNNNGAWYGPNYSVRPPYLPFNGMVSVPPGRGAAYGASPSPSMPYNGPAGPMAVPQGGLGIPGMPNYAGGPGPCGPVIFPSQRVIRSPRDFFMYGEERQCQ
jgi:hypothetical protein